MYRRRIIFSLLLAAVFLLTAGYFFVTGSLFLTKILTPWIAMKSGVDLKIGHAVIRPFARQVILHDFELRIPGEFCLKIQRARGIAGKGLFRGILDFESVDISGGRMEITARSGTDETPAGGKSNVPGILLRRLSLDESEIIIQLKNGVNRLRMDFTNLAGRAQNVRNGGSAVLQLFSGFEVRDLPGMVFSGYADWRGEVDLNESLLLAGVRGMAELTRLRGMAGQDLMDDGNGVQCSILASLSEEGAWHFDKLRLIRQGLQETGGYFEMSGNWCNAPLRYDLTVQRGRISAPFLNGLMSMASGVRPGDMKADLKGRFYGDKDHFGADLVCNIDRNAGKAYFGQEECELPGIQLQTLQNWDFNWKTQTAALRSVRLDCTSEGKTVCRISSSGNRRLDGVADQLDLRFFRLFLPADSRVLEALSGKVSGHWNLVLDTRDGKNISSESEFFLQGVSGKFFGKRLEPSDIGVTGKVFLPLAGETLKVDRFRAEFSPGGKPPMVFSGNGSFPLHGGRTRFNWQVDGAPEIVWNFGFQGIPPPEMEDLYSRFSPLHVSASGMLDWGENGIRFIRNRLKINGRDGSFASFALEDRKANQNGEWKGKFEAAFPIPLAAGALPGGALPAFSGGTCRMEGEVSCSADVSKISGTCEAHFQDVSGMLAGQRFSGVSGGLETAVQYDASGRVSLSRGVFFARTDGRSALRLDVSGTGDVQNKNCELQAVVRYANKDFLDLFFPGRFRSGQLSGNVRFFASLRENFWESSGYFNLEKIQSFGASRPVSGNFRYEIEQRRGDLSVPSCRLELSDNGNAVADVRLSAKVPARQELGGILKLSGEKLDLFSLYEQIGGMTGENTATAHFSRERTILNFGPRRWVCSLDLRNMSWGSSEKFELTGDVSLFRNRIKVPVLDLAFGGGKLRFSVDGMDFPTGMLLSFAGRVVQPVEIAPAAALFYPETRLTGQVKSGEWELDFRRFLTSSWNEDFSGKCHGELTGLRIPVEGGDGPLSRLLLFPVKTAIRAKDVIYSDDHLRACFRPLWETAAENQTPLAELAFDTGTVNLCLSDGILQVNNMDFEGDLLQKMHTEGTVSLQSPYRLALDTGVRLLGVDTRFPIRGTLDAPISEQWKYWGQESGKLIAQWMTVRSVPEIMKETSSPVTAPFVRMMRDLMGFYRH